MAKKNRVVIKEEKFKNLVIDPQLKKNYLSRNFSTSFQPNVNFYSSLIKNADIVITGPTSMLIEASIFYKKILLLGFKSKSSTPYSEELKYFEHLQGIKKLINIKTVKKESDIINDLLYISNANINKKKIDQEREYYLSLKSAKYKENLFSITKNILND